MDNTKTKSKVFKAISWVTSIIAVLSLCGVLSVSGAEKLDFKPSDGAKEQTTVSESSGSAINTNLDESTVKYSAPVSMGLDILAARCDIATAGLVGNEVTFDQSIFARGMNLSKVNSITVTKLPSVSEGSLYLGSVGVTVGQTIPAGNLSLLNFEYSGRRAGNSSFCFSVNDSSYEIKCNIYMLGEVNNTPTVSLASTTSLNMRTHKNVTAYGVMSAHDPEGDELVYEIVKYPEHGILKLSDKTTGAYTYTPSKEYTGEDSFLYVARDKYGNYSASANVSLTVENTKTSLVFSDLEDSRYLNSALYMAEEGLMNGVQSGSVCCFYPQNKISRAEFLCLAMNSAGMGDIAQVDSTVFADDSEITPVMKGYVAKAYTMGIISGVREGGELKFNPNDSLTVSEASVILSNIIGYSTSKAVPAFKDMSSVPTWANDAVVSLYNLGIIERADGVLKASADLTRGECAEMLTKVIQYRK